MGQEQRDAASRLNADAASYIDPAGRLPGVFGSKLREAADVLNREPAIDWGALGGRMSCREVESVAAALKQLRLTRHAASLMWGHRQGEVDDEFVEHAWDTVGPVEQLLHEPHLWFDLAQHMECDEADRVVEALHLIGLDETAGNVEVTHACYDGPEERHFTPEIIEVSVSVDDSGKALVRVVRAS